MPDPERSAALLEELKLNVDLWKHEEGLRQQRNTAFLAINSLLVVGGGTIIGAEPTEARLRWGAVAFGVLGAVLCILWAIIQFRHHAYARFRRMQMADLEKSLDAARDSSPPHTTFARTHDVFSRGGVTFEHEGTYQRPGYASMSAITAEALLPTVFLVAWVAVGLGGFLAADGIVPG